MNTQIVTRPSALRIMADRCAVDPEKLHQTLKNTVFRGASDDELLALVVTSNIYELNPMLREIYGFPKKGGGIVPLVGVDGWIKIANRQQNFDGMEVEVFGDGHSPTHATCAIFLKDRAHPVKITEYFDECVRATDPWKQMPRRMLRNKAISQAVRVAFGVSGIYDEDEGQDIAMRDTSGRVVETTASTKVITGEGTPKASEVAPKTSARKSRTTTNEEPPVESAPAEEVPTRIQMINDLRSAYQSAGIKTGPDAEEVIRKAGLLPVGVGIAGLKNDADIYAIWLRRSEIFPEVADTEPSNEGGEP